MLSVGISFAWLGVQHPSQWPVAVALYILGCKSCVPVLPSHVYLCHSDIIPGRYHPKLLVDPAANPLPSVLSRSGLPRSQAWSAISRRFKPLQMKRNMDQDRVYYPRPIYLDHRLTAQVSPDEHSRFESLERNRVSNISLVVNSTGEVLILGIMIGILRAVKSDASVENNMVAFRVLLAFSGGVWCSFPP